MTGWERRPLARRASGARGRARKQARSWSKAVRKWTTIITEATCPRYWWGRCEIWEWRGGDRFRDESNIQVVVSEVGQLLLEEGITDEVQVNKVAIRDREAELNEQVRVEVRNPLAETLHVKDLKAARIRKSFELVAEAIKTGIGRSTNFGSGV